MAPRTCVVCGRSISWRRAWARDWDTVRHCSTACRRHRLSATDRALERQILDLLDARAGGATMCPSEAARAVSPDPGDEALWRPLLEPARAAARRLLARGEVQILQRGQVVAPSTATGPIRLRRVRRG